jgi:hypothetical protein
MRRGVVSLSLSLNAKQLTNEEKGKIWEDTVERVVRGLALILAEYLRVYWKIKPPPIKLILVARDDRKGPEPKPDFVYAVFINHQLALILRIECHNYGYYYVSADVTERNTIRKFANVKKIKSVVVELWFVVGHVLYTFDSRQSLEENGIYHIWVDYQVLSCNGVEYSTAVQQTKEQLLQQLAPHLVMHFFIRYLKPADIKELDRVEDLGEFKQTLGRLICKRLKEATATQVEQLLEQQEEKLLEELRSSLAEQYSGVYPYLYQHIVDQYPCCKDHSRLAVSGGLSGGLYGFATVCAMGSGVEPY